MSFNCSFTPIYAIKEPTRNCIDYKSMQNRICMKILVTDLHAVQNWHNAGQIRKMDFVRQSYYHISTFVPWHSVLYGELSLNVNVALLRRHAIACVQMKIIQGNMYLLEILMSYISVELIKCLMRLDSHIALKYLIFI